MSEKYNVYEKTNSSSENLKKMNMSPMTKEAAIKLVNYLVERAYNNQKYIVLQHRTGKGYEVNSVRSY
jgi:hypothetical protein